MANNFTTDFTTATSLSSSQNHIIRRGAFYYLFWMAIGDTIQNVIKFRKASSINDLGSAADNELLPAYDYEDFQLFGGGFDIYYDPAVDPDTAFVFFKTFDGGFNDQGSFAKITFDALGDMTVSNTHQVTANVDGVAGSSYHITRMASGKFAVNWRFYENDAMPNEFRQALMSDSADPTAPGNWTSVESAEIASTRYSFDLVVGLDNADTFLYIYQKENKSNGDFDVASKFWNGVAFDAEQLTGRDGADDANNGIWRSGNALKTSAGIVVYVFIERTTNDLIIARYDPVAKTWSTEVATTATDAASLSPSIGLDGTDNETIFWYDFTGSAIRGIQRRNGSFVEITSEFTGQLAGTYGSIQNSPTISISPNRGEFYLVWTEFPPPEVFWQEFSTGVQATVPRLVTKYKAIR